MSAPVSRQEIRFRAGAGYGQRAERNPDAYYFTVDRDNGDPYAIWNNLNGFVKADTFDALAERFGLPLLATIPQADPADEQMLKRAMDRFQKALGDVRSGTYKAPPWMAELSRDLDRHFEPTGHPFEASGEKDCCAVCAQPRLSHRVEGQA